MFLLSAVKLQFSYSLCAILVITVSPEYSFTFERNCKMVLNCANNIYLHLESGSGTHLCHPNISKKKGACTLSIATLSHAFGCGLIYTASLEDMHPVTSARIYSICIFVYAMCVFWFLYPCIRDAFTCMLNIIIVACQGVLRSAVHSHLTCISLKIW